MPKSFASITPLASPAFRSYIAAEALVVLATNASTGVAVSAAFPNSSPAASKDTGYPYRHRLPHPALPLYGSPVNGRR